MEMELTGATAFPSEANGLQHFRFAVSVHDDKLQLWLEDRVSKQQWRTEDLQLSDYVTKDSAIPRATPSDYAKRFVDCLLAAQASATEKTEDEVKAATPFTRALSDVSKDGSRSLVLGVRLGVASSFFVDLEYAFTLLPVALEKVDILDAQVRDLKDEVQALKASKAAQDLEIATLKQQLLTVKPAAMKPAGGGRASLGLRTKNSAMPNDALRWASPLFVSSKMFLLTDGEKSVEVQCAGTYLISLCVSHTSSNTSTQLELMVNGKSIHTFTDGSPTAGPTHSQVATGFNFGSASPTSYARDSTFVITANIPTKGRVSVLYRGNASASAGTMSLVEL